MIRKNHVQGAVMAAAAGLAAVIMAAAAASHAADPAARLRYTADGKLVFPADYRKWIFLSSGMDMSYSDAAAGQNHSFDSVFVNPEAYAAFEKTGHWPDKTVMVLEVRKGESNGSINKRGQFQTELLGGEVHVKDDARFKDTGGWAFFSQSGAMIPAKAGCISCHEAHGAVDTTFVQFYPTLIPIAQAKKTFSAAYLKEEAERAK